jgi:hypothetical protein
MSNIHNHALMEFRAAKWLDDDGKYYDEMQEAICKHVLKLLDVFADEGHSGSSAPYAVNVFRKLAMYLPLVPLTGEDWEWHKVSEGVFQNKRCSRVFKQADRFDGQAYDIDGIVFYEWHTDKETGEKHKSYYTSQESMVPVTFPYTPATEYVERPSETS